MKYHASMRQNQDPGASKDYLALHIAGCGFNNLVSYGTLSHWVWGFKGGVNGLGGGEYPVRGELPPVAYGGLASFCGTEKRDVLWVASTILSCFCCM